MKILGLISGGKDSFYNLMQCVAHGHEIIALGNLHPAPQDKKDELDSYMYQTVGHDVIHLYKECLGVPLYRQEIRGTPIEQRSDYVVTPMDETEDLFELLSKAKAAHPDLQAVSVGAILSNYQRIRVEHVCGRLGLMALAFLWQRNQEELLNEMAKAGVNAILVKIAAIGLKQKHLGQSIGDMYPYLVQMNQQYDLHICGEGGEYETITLDCPLFKRRIVVDESEVVIHSDDHFAQVAYLRFKKLHLEDKSEDEIDPNWMSEVNLDPLWDADSLMIPIEKTVRSKQRSSWVGVMADTIIPHEAETAHRRASGEGDNSLYSDHGSSYRSKFSTHKSDIICAIGGTNAFMIPTRKHLSIAEETTMCLQNVQAKLERIGLTWAEVVFMQVFVSDMGTFGVVNGAYKAFFGINPPPRACVGANLPNSIRIQVNCMAIRKTAVNPTPRKTLHIQGISYWAPANIGPYSQATEQAYHGFIAGQIGMIPSSLDIPVPSSLAKETAWSLRNLLQIATVQKLDLAKRSALCIVYVRHYKDFAPVTAAWEHIASKESPAPVLAICVPSLPKGGHVEWQVMMHQGKVYADKASAVPTSQKIDAEADEDGYETDDDNMQTLEKRELHPTTLLLEHEQPITLAAPETQWKTRTQAWFLSPVLMALSVVHLPETSVLATRLSSLSLADEAAQNGTGPGVEDGWENVVAVTLYYHDTLVQDQAYLGSTFEELLSKFASLSLLAHKDRTGEVAADDEEESTMAIVRNIAVTLVPVQAIAGRGVLALTLHAVGKMPTIPGLLLA
ncbi:hypothetical protein BGZ98_009133 [Dissophora globulifera]|nr:hypothetical protein BGZ98_009133 [Dissophora globulifera]